MIFTCTPSDPMYVVAMSDLGKALVILGLIITAAGVLLWTGIGRDWLGRLPGDLRFTNTKGNFSFHFPIVTCLLLSAMLTLILWFFRK